MANQRKQIIINEITFWRKNKLLPEHYCDFLMTLYTGGNHESEELIGKAKQSVKGKEKQKRQWMLVLFPLLAIILFALLFTIDTVWFTAIPATILAIGTLFAAFYYAKKNELLTPVLYISGALILLGLTVKLCLTYLPKNDLAIYSVLIGNSLFWFLSGLKMKLIYFTISGLLGMVAIIIYSAMNM
ncbi:hypothetical protein AAGS61_03250 [Lysinibacillus sp. KU-BSD001]|uniref:hypothetical protein n=1 Tax=Lysinibacillus sp. KU-BSD001 TaxID=3141328 RepID=UPI0036ED26FF